MKHDSLFSPLKLPGGVTLKNRLVMAPMTRSMADEALAPTETMARYYGRRVDTGLIVGEATIVSPMAQGYPNTPGLYSDNQVAGWRKVTDAVHAGGGKIFAQIWHCGRVSHPHYLDGQLPMAPSAVKLTGRVPRGNGLQYGMPREMTAGEVRNVILEFKRAAANARRAGFDGVELHAANGYLLDQFLHWETNRRTDEWGGTPDKMVRMLLEVIDAAQQEIGAVAVRLSPVGHQHLTLNPDDKAVSDLLLSRLNELSLAYVHNGSHDDRHYDYIGGTVTQYLRDHYRGIVIACGGYSPQAARQLLGDGGADLVAIGRPLIANPDYVDRVRCGQALEEYDASMLSELV